MALGQADDTLPPKLRDLLAARLSQVPDDVLEVLRVAAAAGRTIDDRLLTTVATSTRSRCSALSAAAVDDYILVRTDGPASWLPLPARDPALAGGLAAAAG